MSTSNAQEYWCVGKNPDKQEWSIRSVSLDDLTNWSLQEIIEGPILDVKLEFNGYFERERIFYLYTEDLPQMFVLLTSGALYVKQVKDTIGSGTTRLLDINVASFDVVRSWVNQDRSRDSGLFVPYIINQAAYYAAYIDIEGVLSWLTHEPISYEGTQLSGVLSVDCFRLNDYRIALLFEREDHSRFLLISKRYYIGNALQVENFETNVTKEFLVFTTQSVTDPDVELNPVVTADSTTTIRIHGDFPFVYIEDTILNTFTILSGPTGAEFSNIRIDVVGDLLLDLTVPLASKTSYLKFRTPAIPRIRYYVTSTAIPRLPALLELELIAPPYKVEDSVLVSSTLADAVLTMIAKTVYTVYGKDQVDVTSSLSNPTLTMIESRALYARGLDSVAIQMNLSNPTLTMTKSGVTPV